MVAVCGEPHDGAQQAGIVDTAVLEEAVVFSGEYCVHDLIGNRLERKWDAPLFAELLDQFAVTAVDP